MMNQIMVEEDIPGGKIIMSQNQWQTGGLENGKHPTGQISYLAITWSTLFPGI